MRRKRTFHAAVKWHVRYVPHMVPCCLVTHTFTAHVPSGFYIIYFYGAIHPSNTHQRILDLMSAQLFHAAVKPTNSLAITAPRSS